MPGDGLSNTMDSLPDLDLVQSFSEGEGEAEGEGAATETNTATAALTAAALATDMDTATSTTTTAVSPNLAGILASNVVSHLHMHPPPMSLTLTPLAVRVQAASLLASNKNCDDDDGDGDDDDDSYEDEDEEDARSVHSFVVVADDTNNIDSSRAEQKQKQKQQSQQKPQQQLFVEDAKDASRKMPRRNERQASPQRQQQQVEQQQLAESELEQLQQQDTRKSVRNLRAGEMHALDQWFADCRATEILHRTEWRECAAAATNTATMNANSQNSSTNNSIMTTITAMTNTARPLTPGRQADQTTSTSMSSSSTCWWLSEGRLAVFESLPRQIVGTLFFPQAVGTLYPGTTVIGTCLITLDSRTFSRIETTTTTTNSTRDSSTATTIVPHGRDGWIQLLKVESPVSGYIVLSLNGYSFLAPGLPSNHVDPAIWMWRVTCPVGAFVRAGLDLSTSHMDTIPYGSFVHVKRKTVNVMGLSRLQITAFVDQPDGSREVVDGWCSEFLNPLSGQRGSIVHPVPFSVPALYRVALSEGAVIRSDVELSSPQIGHAPVGAILVVTGRDFSEHPSDQCIERLRLAGNGGWVSVRLNKPPPADRLVVELFEGIDGSFEPNHPGIFHLDALLRVRQEQAEAEDGTIATNGRCVSTTDLSSIEESIDEGRSNSVSSSTFSSSQELGAVLGSNPRPSCNYSPQAKNYNSSSNRRGAGGNNHNNSDELCLICRSEERNATIVHGETGHVACCLTCARMLKARGDCCLVCRLPIDSIIQQFWA
jgi:hypothetical protein